MVDINEQQHFPEVVFVFSGKRKSGKDFVAEKLKETLGHNRCDIIRLSGPLKYEYARQHGLEFDRLLDSTTYKELYRQDMIRWGEEKRRANPTYFCKLATKMVSSTIREGSQTVQKPVWVISDARRKSDVHYFKTSYEKVVHVRIAASEDVRKSRGWMFTAGIDDAESECGLDDETFDFVIHNDGHDHEQLNNEINYLLKYAF